MPGGIQNPTRKSSDCASGRCMEFDGQNTFVDLMSNPTPATSSRTKMAWIKLKDTKSYTGGSDSDERMGIVSSEAWNTGDLHFHVEDEKFGYSLKTSSGAANRKTDPVLNEWINVATSYNSSTGTVAFYVDGEDDL